MKRVCIGALALLMSAAAVPLASAHYCNPTPTITPIGGDFGYVVSDGGQAQGYVVSSWIYQETNGIIGLQRGGTALSTGEADPCPNSDIPDTLLSGVAIDQGQAPTLSPYPGFVVLSVTSGVPMLVNPLGFTCGVPTFSTTGGAVTCNAPALVPPGFAAGCSAPLVGAAFSSLAPSGGAVTGTLSCGAASVQCTSTSAVAGGAMCGASAPLAVGALPATCKAQLQPGTYFSWAVVCMWS